MVDKAHLLTDKKLEQMEKHLSTIYSEATAEIQKTADEYFSRFAKQDEAKRKLLEQGKITEDEYKKWRNGKIMYGKRFTEMKKQCAEQLLHVNETALAYVNGELPEVYALNYNALSGSVNGLEGYSFTMVDANTVRKLALEDKSLLPYKKIDPAKDIPWNMKKINSQVLQGIIQGESIPKISKRIINVQKMNKEAAVRSARTIVTGAENKGRLDSYIKAEEEGIILQKEWIATNDSRVRHSHAMLDGAVIDQDKHFANGLMFPGDPSGRPEEVYNCRCSMAAKVKGFRKINSAKNKNPSSNSLISELESGIIQSKSMQRKSVNTGAFAQYPERMSKKHIRDVAKECGIDLTGITLEIIKDEEFLKFELAGMSDLWKIGKISFFPRAFASHEELIRTIYHEKIHVNQYKKHGVLYVQTYIEKFEKEAYDAEEAFIKKLKERGVL